MPRAWPAPTSCSSRSARRPGCAPPTPSSRGALRRAGARVAVAAAAPQRDVRTFALHRPRVGAGRARGRRARRSTSTTRARSSTRRRRRRCCGRAPGAIRYDAPAAANRPGRHGVWQRPLERRRLRAAPLLVPWADGSLAETPRAARARGRRADPGRAVGSGAPLPAASATSRRSPTPPNPHKKGLDRVLGAWAAARREGEELVVAGTERVPADRPACATPGRLRAGDYRALLRRARVFVTAPRREDYGIAQLEALADGCVLVTTAGARARTRRCRSPARSTRGSCGDDLAARAARRARRPGGRTTPSARSAALAPYRRAAVDRTVARRAAAAAAAAGR